MSMKRSSQSIKFAVAVALVLASGVLFPSAAMAAESPSPGQGSVPTQPMEPVGVPVAPYRLVAVVIDDPTTKQLDLSPLDNPNISGVALQIHWADIEPTEGNPDWTKLDQLFNTAQAKGKWVHLLIFPGFFTPQWALNGVQTDQFPIQYGPGHGKVETLPMPWDKTYLQNWFAFLKLVADRYANNPALKLIAADGPTSVSAESTLPNQPDSLTKWRADGYTPAKYQQAWQQVFQEYAADFPHQFISLSTGLGLSIGANGKIKAKQQSATRQDIVNEAMTDLSGRIVLQSCNVHAGPGPNEPNSAKDDQFITQYNGQLITGLQMRTSAENDPAVMGAAGDPAAALKKSIDLAMTPDSQGRRIAYLEIYAPDVMAPDLQSDLKYGDSLFIRPYLPAPLPRPTQTQQNGSNPIL